VTRLQNILMESRLIYIMSEKRKPQVLWVRHTDTEWVYFGDGKEVKHHIVKEILDNHFSEKYLCVCLTRIGSFEVCKDEFFDKTAGYLGYQNFIIWNASFDLTVEFNRIGVLRVGQVNR